MSKRYFINNLDGLIGNALIKELTKTIEDDAEPQHMGTYIEGSRLDKGKGVKKILKRYKPKLAKKKMLEECDVYIYDLNSMINSSNKQEFSDVKIANEIFSQTPLEEQKVLILVSDVRVWSNTPKKVKEDIPEKKEGEEGEEGEGEQGDDEKKEDEEEEQEEDQDKEQNDDEEKEGDDDEEGEDGEKKEEQKEEVVEEEEVPPPVEYCAYNENDYNSRVPLDKYKKLKRMEDLFLSLKEKENLKVLVVCSGVLYGEGEVIFRNHFKSGWLQEPEALPYLGEGDNLIPTIHVHDLAKFIIKVAENPPENNYLFGIDNSQARSQKQIVQAIANGVGSGKVESVENSDLIDIHQQDIYKLDLDFTPNPLVVSNDPENPVEFEWTAEFGLEKNCQKVLEEFWKTHNLRPLKIMMVIPEEERTAEYSQFDEVTQKIAEHYRIPILNIKQIIEEASKITNDILGDDVREELDNLNDYIDERKVRPIDETMKVFYRAVKWRLSQNDCKNRGFILDNFPVHTEEANWIFTPQKPKKLERIRPKPKRMKRRLKVQPEKEQKTEEAEKEAEGGEEGEEEEEGDQEEAQKEPSIADKQEEGEEGEENEKKEDSDVAEGEELDHDLYEYYEVEEPVVEKGEGEEGEEEEAPAEEEEPEEDEEGQKAKPKVEFYYPESFIFIKRIERVKKDKTYESQILDYFSQQQNEVLVFDTYKKDQFDIFESLRMYIERNKRPYNYLQPETELKEYHIQYYNKKDIQNIEKKEESSKQENLKEEANKLAREKICKEQIDYIYENENEVDEIKDLPFRNYLLKYVVPELNDGLVEVSNFLPDDPVEFLAEYLYDKSFDFTN